MTKSGFDSRTLSHGHNSHIRKSCRETLGGLRETSFGRLRQFGAALGRLTKHQVTLSLLQALSQSEKPSRCSAVGTTNPASACWDNSTQASGPHLTAVQRGRKKERRRLATPMASRSVNFLMNSLRVHSSFNPFPLRIFRTHFSTLDARVWDCLGAEK